MLSRNNADVTHCGKTVFCELPNDRTPAEDRPADICLKMTLPCEGKNLNFFLILVFFLTSRENQEYVTGLRLKNI